ncbi:MAG TPA: hypothetical protein ENJ27_01710 [Candidatus Moranbacteria bacterium]|nr:hypothetical protein [Candidatus Moranbacteria bacterium]
MFKKNKKDDDNQAEAQQSEMHTMADDLSSNYNEHTAENFSNGNDLNKNLFDDNKIEEAVATNSPFLEKNGHSNSSVEKKAFNSSNNFSQKISSQIHEDKATRPKYGQMEEKVPLPKMPRMEHSDTNSSSLDSNKKSNNKMESLENNNVNKKKPLKKSVTIEDRLAKIKKASAEKEKESYSIEKNYSEDKSKSKKVFYLVFAIVIMLIIGTGGYYSWINKEKIFSLLKINTSDKQEQLPEIIQPESKNNNNNQFSDKANFLIVDNLDKEGVIDAINQTFTKMPEDRLLEFVIVDKDNVEMLFTEFSNALELSLTPDITKNLTDKFSIFLYKDTEDHRRMSIVVGVSNKELLVAGIGANSKDLVKEITPLFLNNSISSEKEASGFNTSTYKNINIRYNNLGENSDLSIDYAIIDNNFMIATSKQVGRLIIDKLLNDNLENEENIVNDGKAEITENQNNKDETINQETVIVTED